VATFQLSLVLAVGFLAVTTLRTGPAGVALPDLVDLLSGELLTAGVGGEIDDSQVDAEHVGRLDRSILGHLDRAEQVELALPVDEIGLPLAAALPVLLVGTADEWDQQPAGERPHAYGGQSLEAQDAMVIADGRSRLEDGAPRLVPLEAFHGLGDRPHRELSRNPEPLADLVIGPLVDHHLAEDSGLETDLGGKRRSFVEPLYRGQEVRLLMWCGQQLQLERELHAFGIAISDPMVKGDAAPPGHHLWSA